MAIHLNKVTLHPEKYPTTEHYPFTLDVLRQTRSFPFEKPITLFVGENGSGKSTLLEAITRACRIHIWRTTNSTRVHNNIHEKKLHHFMSLTWQDGIVPGAFFGSEHFKDFVNILDEWAALDPGQLKYFGGESLRTKSHGQSMMAYFQSRYAHKGLYILDEPETALSPRTQIELLKIISECGNSGNAQFLIATHSPILLACPGAFIYNFNESPVQHIDYEQTELYQIYRNFLLDRQHYLSD